MGAGGGALALLSAVADDGMLGWVQPIGASPDSVLETDSQLYGVGAFLLTAEQMMTFTKICLIQVFSVHADIFNDWQY